MKPRSFTFLTLLAVISVIAASYGLWQSGASRHALTVDRTLFADLATQKGDVARIEISANGETIALVRDGKSWFLPQKDRYPADSARLEGLIARLSQLVLIERKTASPARYGDLNLAAPGKDKGAGTEIKLFDGHDAVLADAIIGRTAPSLERVGGGFYARRVDEAGSWLVEGAINVPVNGLDWTKREIFDLYDPKAIKLARLTAAGKPVVTVTRDNPEDEVFSIAPAPQGKADQGKALRLITLPISLPFDDVRMMPAGDLKAARGAVFKSFAAGTDYTLTVFDAGNNIWVKAQESGTGDGVKRFNEFHAKWLYKLPLYRSELLTANLSDYSVKGSQ